MDKQKFFQFCQERTNQFFNDFLDIWGKFGFNLTSPTYNNGELRNGIVVISLDNKNSHDYPLHVPLLWHANDVFIDPQGDIRNHLDLRFTEFRPATYNEICKLTDAQINRILNESSYKTILKLKGVIK